MEILFLDYFRDSSFGIGNMYRNLSEHCHRGDSEIKLYCGDAHWYFGIKDGSITFPNIVYIEKLYLFPEFSTQDIYPDLKEVGRLLINNFENIDDLGFIDQVDFFVDLVPLIYPQKIKHFNPKLRCIPLGDKMYRFTSNKGTWEIKVNGYN